LAGILSLPSYEAGLATGSSESAVLGSGASGPAGLEAIIEFNGTYLNVRDWIDTYLITSIDGLHDADVRDARESNPAQHGETAFDSFYGGRTIVLTGKVRAMTLDKLRDMQLALRQTFAPLQEMSLIFHGKTPEATLALWARKSQPIAMGEVQQRFDSWERDFQVTLRASNPRFTSLIPTSVQIPKPTFNSGAVIAYNRGNFNAQPLITLAGSMLAPELRNETSGKTLNLISNVAADEEITIDIAKGLMIDQDGVTVFNRLDPSSDWLELVPGENTLSVKDESTGPIGMTNPSFDVDTSGWSVVGGMTITRVTGGGTFHSSPAGAALSNMGTGDPTRYAEATLFGTFEAGVTYVLEYFYNPVSSGSGVGTPEIRFGAIAAGDFATANAIDDPALPFTRVTIQWTPTLNRSSGVVFRHYAPNVITNGIYIDSFAVSDIATPPGDPLVTVEWRHTVM
jgi:hypothetical protein